MPNNDVSITDTNIGGNVIGRDDNSTNINIIYERSMYLQTLYEKFQKEKLDNKEDFQSFEDFDYIKSNKDVIGLEQKLKDGHRDVLIEYAKEVKERFHKKLLKTSQYSLAAQEINVYILFKIRACFMGEIYELICNDTSIQQINLLITERIIKPIMTELGLNIFQYTDDDIRGMIYFLTGNCHIKWSK
ncbi:hypothetical protein Barb4_00989 [Bacteroidales bacterium Barb4]|nr:hypothetical protein Barb4_00989 [Bacteroidales bacterium Barb4]